MTAREIQQWVEVMKRLKDEHPDLFQRLMDALQGWLGVVLPPRRAITPLTREEFNSRWQAILRDLAERWQAANAEAAQ